MPSRLPKYKEVKYRPPLIPPKKKAKAINTP
jgi:hypothetical protein